METIVKRIYQVAGAYGLLVLLPQLFMREQMTADMPPEINHLEFYYGFSLVAIAWQFTFFIIASNPKRYRPIMLGTILEKVGFGCLAVYMYFFQNLAVNIFLGGVIDLILMCAFIFAYFKTDDSQ